MFKKLARCMYCIFGHDRRHDSAPVVEERRTPRPITAAASQRHLMDSIDNFDRTIIRRAERLRGHK